MRGEGLTEAESKRIGKQVDKHLAKVRASLDDKSLVKLTKRLNKAVAEVRDTRKSVFKENENDRINRNRAALLADPAECKRIRQLAINEGWNGEKITKKLMDCDRVRNDGIVDELALRFSIHEQVIRDILNNDPRFANVIEEFNIVNRGW